MLAGLLALAVSATAAEKPEAGAYIFSQPTQVAVCRRFDSERFCIEYERKAFGFEEKIQLKEFARDKKTGAWAALVPALGKLHSVPMDVFHRHSACDRVMDDYRTGLAAAPRACVQDSDCTLYPSPWNSCLPPEAAKGSQQVDLLLKNVLSAIPGGRCLILHPPCAAVPPGEASCLKMTCRNIDIGFGRGRLDFKAAHPENVVP